MFAFIALFIFIASFNAYSEDKTFHHYERGVEVPEPMFIDLVRSLNSKKGEWEINSLFADYQKRADDLEWAPEIEYAFADGQAIEFELPSQGQKLEKYKFAYQKTITSLNRRNSLHGMQIIYEVDKDFEQGETSLYHIFAHRFNHHFSMISMTGVKLNNEDLSENAFSFNHTTFYNYTKQVDFGLEINFETSELQHKMFQVIPQIHLALKNGYKLQYGFGTTRINDENGLITSFRLIKEFNLF